jgi:hypothetical protein
MKNTNQVRKNGSTRCPVAQTKTTHKPENVRIDNNDGRAASKPGAEISHEGLAALDALSLLESDASAAIALAMMNAAYIKECCSVNSGWEDFESSLFRAGSTELPRLFANKFIAGLSAWRDEVEQWARKLYPKNPPAPRNRPGLCVENYIGGIIHLLAVQESAICKAEKNSGAWAGSKIIGERLETGFLEAWKAACSLKAPVKAGNVLPLSKAA